MLYQDSRILWRCEESDLGSEFLPGLPAFLLRNSSPKPYFVLTYLLRPLSSIDFAIEPS